MVNKILDKNEYETYILLSKAIFYEHVVDYKRLNYIYYSKGSEETSKICHDFLNTFDDDRAFIHQIYWLLKVLNNNELIKELEEYDKFKEYKPLQATIKKTILNYDITAVFRDPPDFSTTMEDHFDLRIEKTKIVGGKKDKILIFDASNINVETSTFPQEFTYESVDNKYLYRMVEKMDHIKKCEIMKDERINIINSLKDEFKNFFPDIIKLKKKKEEEKEKKAIELEIFRKETENLRKTESINRKEGFKKSIDGAFDLEEEKNKILKINKAREFAKFDMKYKRFESIAENLKVFLSFVFLLGIVLYFILKAIN